MGLKGVIIVRFIINYLRQCFCKHDWELIFDLECDEIKQRKISNKYYKKIYRCKKCGYSKKYITK